MSLVDSFWELLSIRSPVDEAMGLERGAWESFWTCESRKRFLPPTPTLSNVVAAPPLRAHILWMEKFFLANDVCAAPGFFFSGGRNVRMEAFNDPLNNLIQHKELKSSCEN